MIQQTQLVVAGAGLIGKQHIERIHNLDEIALLAIVDPSTEAKQLCEEQGYQYFPDLQTMFARCQPDGVIIATPTLLHVSQAMICLEHKCPVLIEKPIAIQAEDAQQIVALSKQVNTPTLVGHHRRHSALIQNAKSIIASGELGDIRALNMQCWLYKPDDYFDIAPWRKKKGAGPISVNLVHDVDLARHLCGEITSVHAIAHPASRGFENEDTAAAVLHFDNGAVGTISVSDTIVSPWSWEMTAKENPVYPPVQQSSYQIGGSHGSLSVPDMTLWKNPSKRSWWEPLVSSNPHIPSSDPIANQLIHFREVILGNEEPLVSAAEGLKSLRVIEALQQSAKDQRTIYLN